MKIIRRVKESYMVAKFLEAELFSERWGPTLRRIMGEINAPETLITLPDIDSKEQNLVRDELLSKTRGWKNGQYLFSDFPKSVDWYEVGITPKEIESLKYINYSYWVEMSGGSRLVGDVARSVERGREVFGESNQRFLDVSREIEGGKEFPEMILVAENEKDTPVILEGHLRATAYALSRKKPKTIRAILGISLSIKDWKDRKF